MLKETYVALLDRYSNDTQLKNACWLEIEEQYTKPKRHYHTLQHLQHLLEQLSQVQSAIQDWDALLFTLYYHDIIYRASSSENEADSAVLAEKRMRELGVPLLLIEKVKKQVLATKQHLESTDADTNYFLDADLSVLGQDWETYSEYYKNVRKEYAIYPNLIYNPGRKKVLQHFLNMERIFKTEYFYQAFEQQAKQNLLREVALL